MSKVASKYEIPSNWHLNADGTYDVDGSVSLLSPYACDGRLVVKFGKVRGDFSCANLGLTTLEGCPEEVGDQFDCSYNKLHNLIGAPKVVMGDFICGYNQLYTLSL